MKIKSLTKVALTLAVVLTVTSCNDSSSPAILPTSQTAYFVDNAVVGAEYNNGHTTGITAEGGAFKFYEGTPVEFSIGAVKLGSVTPKKDSTITPYDIATGDTAIKIAQFMQSLDDNDNPNDSIVIPKSTRDAMKTVMNIQDITQDELSKIVQSVGKTLVPKDAAKSHLDKTLASLKVVPTNNDNSSNTNANPSTPKKVEDNVVVVPLDVQYKTATSAYVYAKTQNIKTTTDDNNCFKLVENENGKNYELKINSSQWWSTVDLSYSVENTCEKSVKMNALTAIVEGFTVNGASVTTIGGTSQSGNPYMGVNVTQKSNTINVESSSPDCDGDYCSWAEVEAGAIKSFTISSSLGSAIDNAYVASVTLSNSPVPPPPPPLPGNLDIKVDASRLSDVCKNSTCDIKINLIDPSKQITVDSITFNPATRSSLEKLYKNLLPGSYTMAVVQSTLPKGATSIYNPKNAKAIVDSNSTSNAEIYFNYDKPEKLSDLNITLSAVSDDNLSDIKSVVATLTDLNDSSKIYTFTLPIGSNYSIDNLNTKHSYNLTSSGIANAYDGIYYYGVDKNISTLNEGDNEVTVNFTKTTDNTHEVTFNVTNEKNSTKLLFTDTDGLKGHEDKHYIFTEVALTNQHKYTFKNDEVTTINFNNVPAGYLVDYAPKVITKNDSKVDVNFTENKTTTSYDYIAPYKDYNNKILFSIQNETTADAVAFASNFEGNAGWGECFGAPVDKLNINTMPKNNLYYTRISPKDETTKLDLTKDCSIMNTNSGSAVVLKDVAVPQLFGSAIIKDGKLIKLPINHPCKDNGCKDPGNGYVLTGYFAEWSVWGRKYNPYEIPFNNINNIIYAFIGFDPATGDIKSLDSSADDWGLSAASRAMKQYPYMNAHLSFGGWTNNGSTTAPMFETLASSEENMKNFASQAVALMRQLDFSGIDIDWEWWSDYDNNHAPAQKQLDFFKIIKAELDKASTQDSKDYSLTIAISAGKDKADAMENTTTGTGIEGWWSQVANIMSEINIMSYDLHGAFDQGDPAYFQAPWEMEQGDPYANTGYDIKTIIDVLEGYDVPSKKLVMGLPLYGRSSEVGRLGENFGLLETITGTGFGEYEKGILDYKCLVDPAICNDNGDLVSKLNFIDQDNDKNGVWTKYSKNISYEPWAYNANTFITFDDIYAVTMKTRKAKELEMGGMMFWELDGDHPDPKKSLIQATKDELNK